MAVHIFSVDQRVTAHSGASNRGIQVDQIETEFPDAYHVKVIAELGIRTPRQRRQDSACLTLLRVPHRAPVHRLHRSGIVGKQLREQLDLLPAHRGGLFEHHPQHPFSAGRRGE